jgi:tetratricopeptide (TPR) repeat protein
VQQPFAWAICAGIKTVENRSRGTNYRGPIAIHASSKKQRVNDLVRQFGSKLSSNLFEFGAIIGVADLVDVVNMGRDLESDPFACGPVCWKLKNARLLPTPIPAPGDLNLYFLCAEESDRIRVQLPKLQPGELSAAGQSWVTALNDEFSLHVRRAESYMHLDQLEDCIRCLDRAIEINDSVPELYFDRAIARMQAQGDAALVLADCDRALALDSNNAAVFMLRAEAFRLLGDQSRAAEDEDHAVLLCPDIRERWRQMHQDGDEELV